jgi:phage gp16-like protein
MTDSPDLLQRQQVDIALRKKLIQKVKIAQKQLAMDDESYRELLLSETGKRSSTALLSWQLENVLKRMQKLGFKVKPPKQAGSRTQADDSQSRMIRGLWLELHGAGKVHDSSESALVKWAKGQVKSSDGIEALQWLDWKQKQRLIEQLKRWLKR